MKKDYKSGQLKVQQMAFVLVALMILFAIASLFYFSVRYSALKEGAEDLREDEVIETIRKISGTPEFAWTSEGDCASCVDFDKLLVLKDRRSYEGFWKNIALIEVSRVYPFKEGNVECNMQTYPDCSKLTIIDNQAESFRGQSAFVSLCYYEGSTGNSRCDLGKVIMAFETIE